MKATAVPKGRSAAAVPAALPAVAAAAPAASAPVPATADATTAVLADDALAPPVGGFCWSRVIVLFILIYLLFQTPPTRKHSRRPAL